jgi:hypothetical protein
VDLPDRDRQTVPLSDELRAWLDGEGPKTLGGLIDLFGPRSFAIAFVLLLGVPALPVPTGGVTHVFEVIAALLAAQLVIGRDEIMLPRRWRERELAGKGQQRFLTSLIRLITRLERFSKRRFAWLFGSRLSNAVFGLVVIAGSAAAFFAPPFTGLDTLPALGVVLVSLAVLLEDVVVAIVGLVVLAAGVLLEIVLGRAAVDAIGDLF